MTLPADERAELVEHLLASLDAADRERLDALWAAEAEDRLDAYERGEIQAVSAEAVAKA
jgi:putative addiction module component (TIGR02574 family)